ncbi:hypothetical protein Rhal01_03091 [Rubritalea halochordaticola]|uniref:Magnesium transporter CorA family protein n=1 Tax=Rubritalea halochordaticola TaxID=714537 RepID=A0ABP9V2X3_9BACT
MESVTPNKSMIPKTWDVPAIFRNRLGEDVGRQRLMKEEGHLLVVLHEVPKAEDKGNRQGVIFWVNGMGEWKSTPSSGGRSELRELVERYRARIKSLDDELEKTESPSEIHDVIDQATPVLRAARNMLVVVQELRQTLKDDLKVLAIRDLAVAAERAADLLVQDAKSSLDFLIAKSAAQQADAAAKATKEAQKLNRLAAFFFPLMTLAAVFGMNRPSEILSYGGVWVVCIFGLILGGIVWSVLRNGK